MGSCMSGISIITANLLSQLLASFPVSFGRKFPKSTHTHTPPRSHQRPRIHDRASSAREEKMTCIFAFAPAFSGPQELVAFPAYYIGGETVTRASWSPILWETEAGQLSSSDQGAMRVM